jgi:hypothetical protein
MLVYTPCKRTNAVSEIRACSLAVEGIWVEADDNGGQLLPHCSPYSFVQFGQLTRWHPIDVAVFVALVMNHPVGTQPACIGPAERAVPQRHARSHAHIVHCRWWWHTHIAQHGQEQIADHMLGACPGGGIALRTHRSGATVHLDEAADGTKIPHGQERVQRLAFRAMLFALLVFTHGAPPTLHTYRLVFSVFAEKSPVAFNT